MLVEECVRVSSFIARFVRACVCFFVVWYVIMESQDCVGTCFLEDACIVHDCDPIFR